MNRTTSSTFRDSSILIDGHEYVACRFINCTLNFGGRLDGLAFRDCYFQDCRWGFVGAAEDTLHYLTLLCSGFGSGSEKLAAVVEGVFDSIRDHGLEIAQAHAHTDDAATPESVAVSAG